MRPNPQETADLVTFTEEILNGKLTFCTVFLIWLCLKTTLKTIPPTYAMNLHPPQKIKTLFYCLGIF